MIAAIAQWPLFLLLTGVAALSMFVPAAHALALESFHEARTFFYGGLLLLMATGLVGIALSGRTGAARTRHHLLALFAALTILPLALAVPFHEVVRNTSFLNAYFEMVSAFTTTGATLFPAPDRLSPTLHLWRALVGWLGGLMMWVAATAVFLPLNLGGYEVTSRGEPGQHVSSSGQMVLADPARRWQRASAVLVPVYAGLTLALWVMLLIMGDRPLVAFSHAMSTMATSGISPIGGVQNAGSGLGGEAVIFLFLTFALSRVTYASDAGIHRSAKVIEDPELRLGALIVLGVTAVLFLRHWVGAYDVDEQENLVGALRAAWGTLFTILSFLTTAGFESTEWAAARDWSGLGTPGMILMGLALMGGGAATTAGGVKLLRVYALYLQGLREMEKLVQPSSVSGARLRARRIRRQGAVIAWVFFMLFAMSLAVVTLVLTALGIGFEQAITLSVASLTTTGPITRLAGDVPVDLLALAPAVKLVLCAAMVLGRLEMLAIIALLAPGLWRN
ncbi:trk system potassium uptake protein TrkH [Salinihabitans flavidus]|uniref:Trk system potassium uptake protein TrkH n=1 Tax=Salinihabitans flavidus TaxID=569882 RepID=A0A1H8NIW4_9RHOB|nr:potassium transporter TrkG [Salinihabitans flavidus]SEO29560.1 trk system potassium uptake protein TrkH [Salinihabitans flavidus]